MAENLTAGTQLPDTLTAKQYRVLHGLNFGRTYLSASERGDPEVMELLNRGWANCYYDMSTAPIWEISPLGQRVWKKFEGRMDLLRAENDKAS